jgi:hypothetical protein
MTTTVLKAMIIPAATLVVAIALGGLLAPAAVHAGEYCSEDGSADAAGGIPRYGITRRGGNNDRLSTLWQEVISLAGVARSFSKASSYRNSQYRLEDAMPD